MEIRKATLSDLNNAGDILEQARQNIASLGIDQWQNGSPSKEDLKKDIERGELYLAQADDEIAGLCYIGFSGEPTYAVIENGEWIGDGDFCVIHRVAVASSLRGKGVFAALISFAEGLARERGISSLRIDTHRGNERMKNALKKNGFTRCGVIYLENGDERIAFEKIIS